MAVRKYQKFVCRTYQTSAIQLCLLTIYLLLNSAQSKPSPLDITFLGYVTSSSDVSDLSALIQVQGALGNRGHTWRVTQNPENCDSSKNGGDFFVVKELSSIVQEEQSTNGVNSDRGDVDTDVEGGEVADDSDFDESRTLQIVLPRDRSSWIEGRQKSLFLCVQTKTFRFGGEVIKWISQFELSPPTSDYILNEGAPGLLKIQTPPTKKITKGKRIFE